MKPVYLSISAFGPYAQRQEIDFAAVSQNGIFLICGETGAGKTAILDAITYALYGKSSSSTRGDITAMRCQLASRQTPTEIEFIFDVKGARYKFTRTIKYGRKNLTVSQNAMYCENGVYIPFFENPRLADVEGKAAQLLGVNYEQFRQVIMLPQGQFERLLLAKSDEKEKILVSLFGVRGYARAAEIIAEKLLEQRRRLDMEMALTASQLKRFSVQDVQELAELHEQKRLSAAQLAADSDKLVKRHAEIKEQAALAAVLSQRFKALYSAQAAEEKLKSAQDEMQALNERLVLAEKAEGITDEYRQAVNALSAVEQRKRALHAEQNNAKELLLKAQSAKELLNNAAQKSEQNAQRKQKLAYLKEKTQSYEALGEAQRKLSQASSELKCAAQRQGYLQEQAVKAAQLCERAAQETSRLQQEYQSLLTGYISGISGTLAQSLISGSPCPVCGSTQHPSPAQPCSGVTEAQTEAAREAALNASEAYRPALLAAQAAARALEQAQAELNNKKLEAQRLAVRHEELLKTCDKEIKSAQELSRAIQALDKSISEFEAEYEALQSNAAAKQEDCKLCAARIEMHEMELASAEKLFACAKKGFHSARDKNGFADTKSFTAALMERPQREAAATKYGDWRAALMQAKKQTQQLLKELSGKQPPTAAIGEALIQAESEMLTAAKSAAVIAREESELAKALHEIQKRQKLYNAEDAENRENMAFAKQLRGDSGISLQRYVLGVMLNMVVAGANKLLERVHSGRYALYRTQEASGGARKAGLELEVLDKYSGERRSVATLSGGEKFLAALSLSIGLSGVVQAQSGGIALEAMFIDEGFGSLDPASINDALGVLAAVNKTAGTVGIISHVESLNECIPSKITVIKSGAGSRLSVST